MGRVISPALLNVEMNLSGQFPTVALNVNGVGTGVLPLRKHHPGDQQRPLFFTSPTVCADMGMFRSGLMDLTS